MCDIDSVQKIAKYLKINAGKITYNGDNVITRSTKTEKLTGYSTVIQSFLRESKIDSVQQLTDDLETKCLIDQWLEYTVLFVHPANKDKSVAGVLLKELNEYLNSRSYLVGEELTIADLSIFFGIFNLMANLSTNDKEQYVNLSRWFNHLQYHDSSTVRLSQKPINFTTIRLSNVAIH